VDESRCGLCGIPVEPQLFKEHTESLEHLVNQHQMLKYWVQLNTIHKEDPELAWELVEGIKNGSIKRI
jgi:hypothetical protein